MSFMRLKIATYLFLSVLEVDGIYIVLMQPEGRFSRKKENPRLRVRLEYRFDP